MKDQPDLQMQEGEAPGKSKGNARTLSIRRILMPYLAKYLFLAVILLIGNRYLATIRVVRGEDMYPRLRDSDLLLVLRGKRTWNSGDVIVYRKNGTVYSGRVAAGPSDIVSFSGDGDLLVNGSPVWQDVFYPTYAVEGEDTGPVELGEDSYFVLADRRTEAVDSRSLGPVTENEVIGRVFWVLRHRGI